MEGSPSNTTDNCWFVLKLILCGQQLPTPIEQNPSLLKPLIWHRVSIAIRWVLVDQIWVVCTNVHSIIKFNWKLPPKNKLFLYKNQVITISQLIFLLNIYFLGFFCQIVKMRNMFTFCIFKVHAFFSDRKWSLYSSVKALN